MHARALCRRTAQVAAGVLLLLLALLTVRTFCLPSRQIAVAALAPLPVDIATAAERLGQAVRFATVSTDTGAVPVAALAAQRAFLESAFPGVQRVLHRELIAGGSLLYTWEGSDPSLAPVLVMAHQDVVPIAPGTEGAWQQPPFAGNRYQGYVWGRGAWDDKGNLLGLFEALERLIDAGVQPRRTLILASGHDEESRGSGALAIAARLRERGVHPQFILDEGLLITQHMLPVPQPVALVGVAEKGQLTLELTARGTPGHSSMPPPGAASAVGRLSEALVRLERSPFPARLGGTARALLETLAPEARGWRRVALSNLWLFGPLVRAQLERDPSTDAALRTTLALTVLRAGEKENVLPGEASAIVNLRLLPGDSVAAARDRMARLAGPGIALHVLGEPREPSRSSPVDAPGYRLIARTVREVFPGTLVAPGLMIGATDSSQLAELGSDTYRFSPIVAAPADLARFHGTNERISEQNYADLIRFYYRLIGSAVAG